MIRNILLTHLLRARALLDVAKPRRSYNSTGLVFQHSEPPSDHFDISEELVRITKKLTTKVPREEPISPISLAKKFMHCFDVSESEAKRIIEKNKNLLKVPLGRISGLIEFYFDNNISAKSLVENPWLLGLTSSKLT